MKLVIYKTYIYCLLLGICGLTEAKQPLKDTLPTYHAGQTVAETTFIYRKIIEVTDNQHYKVQNFYKQNHQKQSDVLTIKDPNQLATFQELQIYNLNNLMFDDGTLTLWFNNGHKSMSFNIKQGHAEGPFNSYYMMTGNKEIEGYYYAGKPDGLWKYWTETGRLDKQVYYQKGLIQWQKDSIQIQGL